jgi:alkylation response protein AidB-like acyl-CoA dehydrogenase
MNLLAKALDARLGDPFDPGNVLSFRRAMELDERDEYPEEAGRRLHELGFLDYLIPSELGGRLESFEELLTVNRIVARRDPTVAIAHGQTFLGALTVWLAGQPQQKEVVAQLIREGEQAALALTEEAHGSDILANDLVAEPAEGPDGGYYLTGEKWLINNGTRGALLVVHALTGPFRRGPRGYSLFMVDKRALDRASFSHLPRKRTLGIRGADISGIRFDRAFVPRLALIGELGRGFDLTLKALQVSRTLCAGFSLGAADTALRIALRFVTTRRLYGNTVFAIPHTRRLLVEAFLRLVVCEQVAVAAVRGLHAATDLGSVWSAVVKYFVPTTIEEVIRTLAVLLGARHYLREGHDFGVFQKLMRDNLVVGLFDGSTVVNLQAIGIQLHALHGPRKGVDPTGTAGTRLRRVFSLVEPLPRFDAEALQLFNRGVDDVVQGVQLAQAELTERGASGGVYEEISTLAAELTRQVEENGRRVAALGQRHNAPELFDLAARYCSLFAAAACLHSWRENRNDLGEFFAEGAWLVLCLEDLLAQPYERRVRSLERHGEAVARHLAWLHDENRLFSLSSFELAPLGRSQR